MYLLFVLLFSYSTFALDSHKELATSKKWIRLLHYKKNLWGSYQSQADGQGFFLHKDGKNNPLSELLENIRRFGETTRPTNEHPICKFPLRYKWLNKMLGMPWKADFSGCKNYIAFFSKLAAKRASMVFSSYYLSNPNSAFGHTLMRLSRYDDKAETEMLDYGINYSARSYATNPFSYAWKGLFGGFKGEFAAIPYYYKIREYSDFEFRDLWSFDLKMSMAEVLEMVDHIWELGSTDFDYWYFDENCAYHLLSIIEVALPHKNLTDNYRLYAIPADTIRLLHQEGLIDEGKRRESTYSRLLSHSKKLSTSSLKLAKKIAQNPQKTNEILSGIETQEAAGILDTSLEAFDYYNFDKILVDDPKTKKIKESILVARAKNPVISADVVSENKTKDSPALSHSPLRLGLGQSYTKDWGQGTRFEFRAAMHDLLDPLQGSLKEAQLEVFKLSVKYQEFDYERRGFVLDHFSLFNIFNYPEQNFWVSPFSWEIDAGVKQLIGSECSDCPAGYLSASLGNSVHLFSEKLLMALLLNGEFNIQSEFSNNYRLLLGPRLVSRFRFTDKVVVGMSTTYGLNTYEHDKFFQDYAWSAELETRFHLRQAFSIFLKGRGVEQGRNWRTVSELGLLYYYD